MAVGDRQRIPVAAGVWKLEDGWLPWREGGWWSSPRQRRVVPALPDGAGSASEMERHTDRNQRLNAPQDETTDPESGGCGSGCIAHLPDLRVWWGTPGPGDVAGREAMVKACGVAMAKVQGHSWVPIPSKGSRMNVGTVPVLPGRCHRQWRPVGVNAWPVDRVGTGRRARSTPRPGKPVTWGRGPAGTAQPLTRKETHW